MPVLPQTGELAPIDKPWQLIRDALFDLELQEKTEGIVIDMGEWNNGHKKPGLCHQCLAGCTLSRRCGEPTEIYSYLSELEDSVYSRIHSLDDFRVGDIVIAYQELDLDLPSGVPLTIDVADYHEKPEQFKSDMHAMADMLEAAHKGETT